MKKEQILTPSTLAQRLASEMRSKPAKDEEEWDVDRQEFVSKKTLRPAEYVSFRNSVYPIDVVYHAIKRATGQRIRIDQREPKPIEFVRTEMSDRIERVKPPDEIVERLAKIEYAIRKAEFERGQAKWIIDHARWVEDVKSWETSVEPYERALAEATLAHAKAPTGQKRGPLARKREADHALHRKLAERPREPYKPERQTFERVKTEIENELTRKRYLGWLPWKNEEWFPRSMTALNLTVLGNHGSNRVLAEFEINAHIPTRGSRIASLEEMIKNA